MSIEIHIFPTIDHRITVAELDMSVRLILGRRFKSTMLPETVVSGRPSEYELKIDDSVQITLGRSLFLYMWQNEENQLYFLEGQANNVSQAELESIANRNEAVGYHYNLDSKMGRTAGECCAMLAVAASIAKLTDGLILLADHPVENVPRGGYTCNQIVEKIESYDGKVIEPMLNKSLPFDTENGQD